MAPSLVSAVLSGSVLLAAVNAQNFEAGGRDEDAFEYVQPLNTTILTEYGSSPAVYPSRKSSYITKLDRDQSNTLQQTSPALVAGRWVLRRRKLS